jgi:glucokinase
MDVVLALDIGVTESVAGLMTMSGELLDLARVKMDPSLNSVGLFDLVTDLLQGQITRAEEHHKVAPVVLGVGIPGPISDNFETVAPLGLTGWRDFPLRKRLAEFTRLPVFVDLDGKALALAEGWLGAAQGYSNFVAMVVSDVVSGGVVLDGQLLDGASGNAGNIGHVIVEPNGRRCACGGRGCLEAETSERSIEAMTGRPASSPSYATMVRTGKLVGRGVASICNMLDLDLVVVGGSVALGFGATFFNAGQESISEHCKLSFSKSVRMTPARLADRGSLIGAGAIGLRGMRRAPNRAGQGLSGA